ncbi:MAG: ATP-binding cassette domain-containing protein [Bacteroidota bacterium]
MNEINPIVELNNVSVKTSGVNILNNINLVIRAGEQWAVIGNSGTGKTTLAHALTGKIFYSGSITYHLPQTSAHSNKVLLIEQQHRFKNLSNTNDFYYQQRFNSSDADNSITAEQALKEYGMKDTAAETIEKWIELLHLAPLLQEPLIQLSNGENKRLQLAEALLSNPAILILDNPFIGLDTEGRKTLHTIIDTITKTGIHIILVTGPQELPGSITHVAILENGSLSYFTKEVYISSAIHSEKKETQFLNTGQFLKIKSTTQTDFEIAIKMENVCIQYGNKRILDNINWEVKRGDCWNISGPNGAGKSTLLSLITADNPQAYANEIYLFDKKRGKGESIWDIKRRIGYVSPELHLFFEQYNTGYEVIASGLFDTIGLFRQLSEQQAGQVESWIELLQLQKLRQKPLFQLSLGQQRMVLLARALVKNPPVLILDEPCQGLDEAQTGYFKNFIDQLCRQFNTTLLYVSHYEKDIPGCVDKFLRLENGKRVR